MFQRSLVAARSERLFQALFIAWYHCALGQPVPCKDLQFPSVPRWSSARRFAFYFTSCRATGWLASWLAMTLEVGYMGDELFSLCSELLDTDSMLPPLADSFS